MIQCDNNINVTLSPFYTKAHLNHPTWRCTIKVTGFDEQRYSECARFILDQAGCAAGNHSFVESMFFNSTENPAQDRGRRCERPAAIKIPSNTCKSLECLLDPFRSFQILSVLKSVWHAAEAHLVPLPLEESNILWEYDHVLAGPEPFTGFRSSRVGMALRIWNGGCVCIRFPMQSS